MPKTPSPSWIKLIALALATSAIGVSAAWWWLAASQYPAPVMAMMPQPVLDPGLELRFPGRRIAVRAATAAGDLDALRALRVWKALTGDAATPALIATRQLGASLKYEIMVPLPNDAISATNRVASLSSSGRLAPNTGWSLVTREEVESWEEQTRLLQALYHPIPEVDKPGSQSQSAVLADILVVAQHYSLPLSLFAEAGSRDSDYLDANGLVEGARWRTLASADELVIAHGPEGVLSISRSAVSWQLTEQAVRYAHSLYTKDGADAQRLPLHLRPPAELANDLPTGVVITYGGRILRDLLDLCHGNSDCVAQALATNSADPSLRLELGVRRAALYARRALHHIGATARSMIRP